MYCVWKQILVSQVAVNMNFSTVIFHKCRAGYTEGTKLEIKAKCLVILWYNITLDY
jgi:hypothetical protein